MRLLLITGLPGTGKTTLAQHLARRHGVPLLSKDLIKEPLLEVLGAGDAAHSRLLSDASFAALFAVARQVLAASLDVILEGNFRPGKHEAVLAAVPSLNIVQILCRVDEATRRTRLTRREHEEVRHAGHRDTDPAVITQRSGDEFLELPGERLTFDSSETANPRQLDAIDRFWKTS